MNKLNVFHHDWCSWRSISGVKENVKTFLRGFKFAYQRVTRGFCDLDWWDLDHYYLELLHSTLKHFAENTISYPMDCTSEEWPEKVKTLSDKFAYLLQDNDEENEYAAGYMEYLENIHFLDDTKTRNQYENFQEYCERDIAISKKKQDLLTQALKDLAQLMPDLWD